MDARRPYRTFLLIGLNVVVFGVMVVMGVSPTDPESEQLLRFGANRGTLVIFDHEWWRPLTSVFVHIGALHLLVNMYSLWRVGAFVERMLSGPMYLLVYLLAGLGGAFASILWNPLSVSAGASGAIFGLFGFITGFAVQARHLLPPDATRSLWDGILATIAINVFLALSVPYLDNAAHLGGAAIGLLSGFVGTASAIERQGKGASFGSQLIVIASVAGLAVLSIVRTQNNPEVRAQMFLLGAEAAAKAKDFVKAEELSTKAIELSREPGGLVVRSIVRRELGDLDGGLADLDRFIDRVSGSAERREALLQAFELRSAMYFTAENYARAEADLTRALNGRKNPDWLGSRAFARLRLGDLDGGVLDARASLADSSTDGRTLNNVAWALVMTGEQLELALQLADEAVERAPSAAAKGTRCWVRVARGEPDRGLLDCLSAVAESNEPIDRGMVAYIQNRPDEAVQVWEQASQRSASDTRDLGPWIAKARAQLDAGP
jgi:membrane associated rhomboid family serine protease